MAMLSLAITVYQFVMEINPLDVIRLLTAVMIGFFFLLVYVALKIMG